MAELAVYNMAAENAYRDLANEARHHGSSPENIYQRGFCRPVSKLMRQYLSEAGLTDIDQVDRSPYRSNKLFHIYLLDLADPEEPIVVDGTWQQFLEFPSLVPNLPKVLVGSRAEVVAQVEATGIKDDQTLDIWRPLDQTTTTALEHSLLSNRITSCRD